MGGLEPPIQSRERRYLLLWMAGSSPAMVNQGFAKTAAPFSSFTRPSQTSRTAVG